MKAIWRGFTSVLADSIQAYLEYKRAIKRKFWNEETVLRLLDRYLVEHRVNALNQSRVRKETFVTGSLSSVIEKSTQ